MELTMTLTVTPEQAAAIANLLTDTKSTIQPALATEPDTPAASPIPQQPPTTPQAMPTAAPVAISVLGCYACIYGSTGSSGIADSPS